MADLTTRLVDLTVGQLLDFLNQTEKPAIINPIDERVYFGDKEIGSFFGRSISTVQTWKKAGYFDLVKTDGSGRLSVNGTELRKIAREFNLKIK